MPQKTTREFWVSDPCEDAVRKTKLTLKKLGDLTAVVPGQHVVGSVAFGVQKVALQIAWRPEVVETKAHAMTVDLRSHTKNVGTLLVMEASLPEKIGSGGDAAMRNAFERFEDAYLHFDRDDYTPDRMGLLPVTIVGVLLILVLVGVLLARRTDMLKPVPAASPGVSADVNAAP